VGYFEPQPLELAPPHEVRALWDRCLRVSTDEEVADWLRVHRIDIAAVDAFELARVLPKGAEAPAWARYGAIRWKESGYRLLVPLYGPSGVMEALYARSLRPIFYGSGIRSYPPVTGASGFVMANATGLSLLRSAKWPTESSWRTVIVAGGAADFLDWATSVALEKPAVFGLVPGSWTRDIASRIPTGSRVIVRAHQNPIAGRYAHRVQDFLAPRCQVIVRTAQ
jgi:hypothetical protein